MFCIKSYFLSELPDQHRHSPLLKPGDYPQKFQLFRKLILQKNPKYRERRLSNLPSLPVQTIPSINDIKRPEMRKLLIALKTKDSELYQHLKDLTFESQKRYLKINKERYLFDMKVLMVGGAAIGGGIFISRYSQDLEVDKIRGEVLKVKQKLAASRMDRRKDIEALQDSIVTLKTRLSFLKDIASTRGMDLNNYIDSKVEG